MAKTKTKTINEIAKALVDQNPQLKELVENNPGTNYKLVEAAIRPLMTAIGQATGQYVRRQQMIWAIINEVEGSTEATTLQLKL